jgi:hypothetical protein
MIAEFGKEKQINNVLLYFVPKILEDKFGVELQPVLKEANFKLVKITYDSCNEWTTSHFKMN